MINKTELNKEYNEALLAIREIVNKIDPINLFPGVPEDEYDPEVSDILSEIINCNTSEELTIMVQTVFKKWFSEKIDKSRLVNVGEDLQLIKTKYTWLNKK
jgi:hypothetical protein